MRRYALMPGGDDRHPAKDAVRRASGGAVPAEQTFVLRNRTYATMQQLSTIFLGCPKFNDFSVDSCGTATALARFSGATLQGAARAPRATSQPVPVRHTRAFAARSKPSDEEVRQTRRERSVRRARERARFA